VVEEDQVDWAKLAEQAKDNDRPHAGYFSWETNRAIAEYGIVWEFEGALKKQGELFFSNARHRGTNNDPPDCEADDNSGGQIGIELTELVDPASAEAARLGKPYDWKDWRPSLVSALENILGKKDSASSVKGGPYTQYVLLVHTDEPWLVVEDARLALALHEFSATRLITRAYLLMSYDPIEKQLPCIRMRIKD
jgi:hypothetical protein